MCPPEPGYPGGRAGNRAAHIHRCIYTLKQKLRTAPRGLPHHPMLLLAHTGPCQSPGSGITMPQRILTETLATARAVRVTGWVIWHIWDKTEAGWELGCGTYGTRQRQDWEQEGLGCDTSPAVTWTGPTKTCKLGHRLHRTLPFCVSRKLSYDHFFCFQNVWFSL